MAKKTPVKKSKRRLKRGVRRSLAAVLMITAIGVAAIPVPENYAAPENDIMPLVAASHSVNYSYPSNGADEASGDNETPVSDDVRDYYWMKNPQNYPSLTPQKGTGEDNKGGDTIYDSKVIRMMSDGEWELNWQFRYYNSSSIGNGVICEYNSEFKQSTVKLDYNVYYAYDTVTEATYNAYYTAHNSDTYTVKNPDSTVITDRTAAAFLSEYFPEDYEQHVKDYKDYQDGKIETEPTLSRTVGDLGYDQKRKYYCDHNVGNILDTKTGTIKPGTDENGKPIQGAHELTGYILEEVNDRQNSGATAQLIYVPRKIEGVEGVAGRCDTNGFKILGWATVGAIGDGAFKGVGNVDYLTVPEEIGYIGESAFEDSFIKSIAFVNIERIGNRAFKNCSQLTQITMGDGTKVIGTEAFYNTGVTSISFPYSVNQIGPGAFAACSKLQSVDFSKITVGLDIYDYAFYNDGALNSVNFKQSESLTVDVSTIGYAAFAAESVTGSMNSFEFPTTLSTVAVYTGTSSGSGDGASKRKYDPKSDAMVQGLGDLVLAGRTNLEYVVFPADMGRNRAATLPDDLLYNCSFLQYVEFPADANASCGSLTYNPEVFFSTISNRDFYVRGPEFDRSNEDPAAPRVATWKAQTRVSDVVPYVYVRNGVEYYEVSDGYYLLCIDSEGVLTSCTFVPGADVSKWNGELVIPSEVGDTKVTGIASDCFTDSQLNENVKSLVIEDDSVSSIADGAFQAGGGENKKDWLKLEKVYIGNSVESVGKDAFRNCRNLIDVTFASPSSGHEAFTIGENAFTTQSQQLTFHGDIVKGYDPFDWAMDPNNVIETEHRLRVCYKSLLPTYLTVMYNPITEMVTLLDYPKYGEINSILNTAYADEIRGYGSYEAWREATVYAQYGTSTNRTNDLLRVDFAQAWQAWVAEGKDKDALEQLYASNLYGPWIYPGFDVEFWANYDPDNSGDQDEQGSVGKNGNKLTDWLFEPIIAYAAEETPGNAPLAYFDKYPYNVALADSNPYATQTERSLIYYTKNIVIPEGVESIDVYGYVYDRTLDGQDNKEVKLVDDTNYANVSTYLTSRSGWQNASKDMYQREFPEDEDGIRSVPGLFSGYYDDGTATTKEERKRGNDVIISVTMNSVKYLPNYAFDSCESLDYVILGPDCADIGKAPFRGCHSMRTVGDNDYYTTVNGIIYSVNTDGSYTIEECLAGRGNLVGQAVISASIDPDITNVSAIKPGAFEDCDYLTEVNFGSKDTAGLTLIPEDCFKNSDRLQTVVLPMTTNEVAKGAFVGANNLSGLTIYGKEVQISARAFDTAKLKEHETWTTVRAYANSAVVRYVGQYGDEYGLRYDEQNPLGEIWLVSFYDSDYVLIEDLKDRDGNDLDNPQYVEDGARPTEPATPEKEGWTFERWVGNNNVNLGDAIHEDTSFYAQGYTESGMVNGKYPVSFWDGVDGTQVGPTQNIEPGSDAVAPGHPVHEGYEQDGYSDTYTNIQSPKTIILKYKPIGGAGGGSGTPGSGSNGSTSNQNSSSSTSSTTSGSGTTAKYTVTVENGSGSGSYDVGSTVIIAANTPPAGMIFQKWTTESNGVALASVSMTATTFVMPANNVTVTANYVAGSNASNSGTTGRTNGNTSNGNTGNGSTRVDITKPGISNKDLATANVNGSTDNFIVKITETDEATRAVADALTNKYGSLENILYYAMDISLYDSTGTVKISDTTGITVDITIPIPDALVAYGGNNMAGAVINGNQLESLNENFTTINGVPCIRFTATHFSPYTIYVDTGNLTQGMLDTTPKTGDPIHPKWFLSIGLACLSIILFMKKDKAVKVKTA